MSISPTDIIKDLETYIDIYNISISADARKTLEDIEEFSFKCDSPCNYILFFSKTIRNMKELQRLFYSKGINPNLAALILEIRFYDLIDINTSYQKGSKLYSYKHDRSKHDKTAILDKSMQYCVSEERTTIENKDIILAAMDYFEDHIFRSKKDDLSSCFNIELITLSHVCGKEDETLMLAFDDIKQILYVTNKIKVISG